MTITKDKTIKGIITKVIINISNNNKCMDNLSKTKCMDNLSKIMAILNKIMSSESD